MCNKNDNLTYISNIFVESNQDTLDQCLMFPDSLAAVISDFECAMIEQRVENRDRYLSRGETVNQGRRESRDPFSCHQVFVDTNDNF